MPGCVFRASGVNFDVDVFWAASPWQEYTDDVYHRGAPTNHPIKQLFDKSGFYFGISDYDEDRLDQQIQDCITFLTEDRAEIKRLAAFPGVDDIALNIGLFWWADTLCLTHELPPELLRLAGELGVAVALAIYGTDRDRPTDQESEARKERE